jgi:signal transduction histidine kinase
MWGGIRVRIVAIAMAVVIVVLVATGVALLASQRKILTDNLDDVMRTQNRIIEQAYTAHQLNSQIAVQGDEDAIAQVVDGDGRVLASTRNFAGQIALDSPGPHGTTFRTVSLPVGKIKFRLMSRSVNGVVIHTGTPVDDVDESVAALRKGLGAAIPVVAIVIGACVWWLVGRTLRPVELIRSQVAAISNVLTDQRVSEPATKDEIARLARTMNAMLDRIEGASRREQRFVADASHELRIPLTRIRSELEVDLAHPGTGNLVETHHSVLEEVGVLQRLVEDLLHLARSDNHTNSLETAPVDLDDLALAEARRLRADTSVLVDTTHVSAAQATGDREQLERAIRNLCDNAARHARSRVTLATSEEGDRVHLTVGDDGSGIPEHDRSRVFERFARLDPARENGAGGSGLGLAITLDIIERHGGTIAVEENNGGGASFVVTLPRSRVETARSN